MRVFIINARRLMIGAAVLIVVLVAGMILMLSQSQDVSSHSFQNDIGSLQTVGDASNDSLNLQLPTLAMDVTLLDNNKANVKLLTQNFQFVTDGKSEMVTAEHGKGHAHIYLDGKLIAKVFDSEFVLTKLPKGEHELRVELAYGNHTPYKVDAAQKFVVK
ncbi:MAG: hypothetical protein ACM32O_19755 [Clostridia bacterium]